MTTTEREIVPTNPAYSSAVQRRYKDAYFFAKSCIKVGDVIKMLAAFVTGICIAASCLAAANSSSPSVAGMGILVSGVVGLGMYICGILIAALGQVLIALLDTALNTSPYLDDDTRAEAMSLVNTSAMDNSHDIASKISGFLVNPGMGFAKTTQDIAGVKPDGIHECPWCHTRGAQIVKGEGWGGIVQCPKCLRDHRM